MSEFKGTSGKWVSNGNNVLIDEYSRQIQLEYNCGGFGIEREYNALLISKAPDLLSEIIDFVETTEEEGVVNLDYFIPRFKQLIKEATEL